MTTTEQAFQSLLANQMLAFASHMATQYPDLNAERLNQMANEHCTGLNLVEATAAIPKKRGKKAARSGGPRSTPVPEERCMARVWHTGSGNDQCAKSRADGDYCKGHAKKALIGELAIQVAEEAVNCAHVPAGKRVGLWCGRIDQFQDGQQGIPPYKDSHGIVRIEWTTEDMRARVSSDVEAGTARYAGDGEKKRKSKPKSTATVVDTNLVTELEDANTESTDLMDALTTIPEPVVETEVVATPEPVVETEVVASPEPVVETEVVATPEPVVETEVVASPEPVVETEVVATPVPVVETDVVVTPEPVVETEVVATPEPVVETNDELLDGLVGDADKSEVYEAETEDDEMEVEERTHDGETYYVEPKSGDIYNVDTGDVIGTWEGDAATGSPNMH